MSESGSSAQFGEIPGQQAMFDEPERLPLWRMSPEQFANHPNTVFHASYRANALHPKTTPKHPMYYGTHAGTEQAALERAAHKRGYNPSVTPRDESADPHLPDTQVRMILHRWNLAGVHRLDNPLADWEANESPGRTKAHDHLPTAYINDTEDRGSVSVVMHSPSAARTHTSIVEQALYGGEDPDKVHPLTRHLYETGQLETFHKLDPNKVRNELMPEAANHDAHAGGLFPYTVDDRPVSREEVADHVWGAGSQASRSAANKSYDTRPLPMSDNLFLMTRGYADGFGDIRVTPAPRGNSPRSSNRGDLRRGRQFTEPTLS